MEQTKNKKGRPRTEGDRHMYTVAQDAHEYIMEHGGGRYLTDTIRIIKATSTEHETVELHDGWACPVLEGVQVSRACLLCRYYAGHPHAFTILCGGAEKGRTQEALALIEQIRKEVLPSNTASQESHRKSRIARVEEREKIFSAICETCYAKLGSTQCGEPCDRLNKIRKAMEEGGEV